MPSGVLHYALVDTAQVLKTIQMFFYFFFHNARLFHVVENLRSVEHFSFKKAFVCLITEPAVQPSTRGPAVPALTKPVGKICGRNSHLT